MTQFGRIVRSRTSKIEQDTKSHDADALLGGEVSVGGSHVLILLGRIVIDLDVGGKIAVPPFLGILVEHLLGNFSHVQLVVSCSRLVSHGSSPFPGWLSPIVRRSYSISLKMGMDLVPSMVVASERPAPS